MKQQSQAVRIYYVFLTLAVIAYTWLTFATPPQPGRYNLTPQQTTTIRISLVVPIVLIWLAAVYGASRFKAYASLIKGSQDGQPLNRVANGLLVLSFGAIISSLVSVFQSFLNQGVPSANIASRTIINNYVTVMVALVSYLVMSGGAKKLLAVVDGQAEYKKAWRRSIIPFGIFVALYVFMMFQNPNRNISPQPGVIASFYLPDIWLVLTIMIPNIMAWTFGVISGLSLHTYMKLTKGILYKRAMARLSTGILVVISFSILLALFTTLSGVWSSLNLKAILIVVYLIILLYALGYLIIASGARKLAKIEEV